MKFLTSFIFLGFLSCKQQESYSQAKQLTDSASKVFQNTHNPLKALSLLNQAVEIDSNYVPALTSKLNFEMVSNMPDKALVTAMRLIKIKPEVSEYYTALGFIYEQKNDTISSKKIFLDAVARCDKKLDGMSKLNKDYDWILLGKASNLLFAGDERRANDILKELYDRSQDETFKGVIKSFMNKSKQQILEEMK